jgi:hypothetical protein
MLNACGITDCRPLLYSVPTYDQSAPGNNQIGGRHIGVRTATGRSSVIVMRSDYPAELSPAFVCACTICILYHELGHAHDFREGFNFNHHSMQYDPEAGEKYADAFARERLKQIKCKKVVEEKDFSATLWQWYNQVRYIGNFVS